MTDTPTLTVIHGGKSDDPGKVEEHDHLHDMDRMEQSVVTILEFADYVTEMDGTCVNCVMFNVMTAWTQLVLAAVETMDKDQDREAAERGFEAIETVTSHMLEMVEEERAKWDR